MSDRIKHGSLKVDVGKKPKLFAKQTDKLLGRKRKQLDQLEMFDKFKNGKQKKIHNY